MSPNNIRIHIWQPVLVEAGRFAARPPGGSGGAQYLDHENHGLRMNIPHRYAKVILAHLREHLEIPMLRATYLKSSTHTTFYTRVNEAERKHIMEMYFNYLQHYHQRTN